MNKLNRLKLKYENAKYEPIPECVKCRGIGEYKDKMGSLTPCLCIYIQPDIYRKVGGEIRESLHRIAVEGLAELINDRERGDT
jgi:hypothetical protein